MFIAFSGIDSAGKSTQISNIVEYLNNHKRKTKVIWSRVGYTPLFNWSKKTLRKIVPNSLPEPGESRKRDQAFNRNWVRAIWFNLAIIDMMVLYCLYFRLLKMLGYTVIADRYIWDTYIDFKLKFKGKNFHLVVLWKLLLYLAPVSDKSFLLTIPVNESIHRSKIKNEPFSENRRQRKNRYDLYQDLKEKEKWDYIIDGLRPIDEVWYDIKNKL